MEEFDTTNDKGYHTNTRVKIAACNFYPRLFIGVANTWGANIAGNDCKATTRKYFSS